eukprot:gene10337-11412_t
MFCFCRQNITTTNENGNSSSTSREAFEIGYYQDPCADQPDLLDKLSDEENEDSFDDEMVVKMIGRKNRKKPASSSAGVKNGPTAECDAASAISKKKQKLSHGKERVKAKWTPCKIADLMDIVICNESFKRKLIFTNTPNSTNGRIYTDIIRELEKRSEERDTGFLFSVTQVRNKFKKLVAEYKKTAFTATTASGITRFQEKYGKWFTNLFPVVKQRASCDPDQATEPSTIAIDKSVSGNDDSRSTSSGRDNSYDDAEQETNKGAEERKLFIPVKGANKKKSTHMQEMREMLNDAIEKAD